MALFWKTAPPPAREARAAGPWPALTLSEYAAQSATAGAEAALQSVAVSAAVDLLASLASELPVDVFRGAGADRTEVPMRRHPWLADPAGTGHGLQDWIYQLMMSWLLRGNAYGLVHERGPTAITQLEWMPPDAVAVQDADASRPGPVQWSLAGTAVQIGDNVGDLVHRRINPSTGRLLGVSPIRHHMHRVIRQSLVAAEFGQRWFTDGGHPSALLTNEEAPIDEDTARVVKRRFLAALRGSREPVVFGKGWKYQPLQVNAEESQFLETQGYTAAECARIFGPGIAEVLGYSTGGSLTYTNVQAQGTHLLTYSVNRWLLRVERALGLLLPAGQYAVINRDAMLQSTTLERHQAHASALDKRWRTVNEIRELENLRPVPWGDGPNPVPGAPPENPDQTHTSPDDEKGDG
ncbi:phage portal protein [Streptomyces carpaticus]|uniref:phage portal protein n=1 Tax=Streptomyces carpaticus TaxID=285558 RepID=UPI0031F75118